MVHDGTVFSKTYHHQPRSAKQSEARNQHGGIDREAIIMNLPVFAERGQIVDTVRNNKVTIITGTTGSGKSTLVPLFLMDDVMSQKDTAKTCNIIVAMPRRIAVVNIARYVCWLRRYQEGAEVGYQVGMAAAVRSRKTRILFCTTGVLLQKLTSNTGDGNPLAKFSHVIIDEVHERSEDVDFALLLVRMALDEDVPFAKVVVMSATMESTKMMEYFKDMKLFTMPPKVAITRALHEMEEKYLDDICTSMPLFSHDKACANRVLMDLVLAHIEELNVKETAKPYKGTILVFLSGLEEIEQMIAKISVDYANKLKSRQWEVCPLHSLIPLHVQQQAFAPTKPYCRRIVLATNIAESSITVPDVEIVYDFCLEKIMVTDEESRMSYLQLQWTTKSNCDQRKGRAGRVRNGKVFRLVPKTFYDEFLQYPSPAILNVPAIMSVLRVKILKFKLPPIEVLAHSLSPPSVKNLQRAVLLLKEKGALSLYDGGVMNPENGDLTKLGRMCSALPFSPSLSRLVYLSFAFGLSEDGIVLACLISVRSIFYSTWKGNHESYLSKKRFDQGFRSDTLASFRVFREWMFQISTGLFPDVDFQIHWCRSRSLSMIRLQEVHSMVDEIRHRLQRMGMYVPNSKYYSAPFEGDVTWELLIKVVIAGAFYPDYVCVAPAVTEADTLETFAEAASRKLEVFGGNNPLNSVEIMLPGRPELCMPVFYDKQLRKWIGNLLKSDVKPLVMYRGNRAVVTFEQSSADKPGACLLSVEFLIRLANFNVRQARSIVNNFCAVNEKCGKMLLAAFPELQHQLEVLPAHLPWLVIDRSMFCTQIPLAVIPYTRWSRVEVPMEENKANDMVTEKSPQAMTKDENVSLWITNVLGPCWFFGRVNTLMEDPIISMSKRIKALENGHCLRLSLPSDLPKIVGQVVLAPFNDCGLARGRVVRTCRDQLEVNFVDYGVTSLLSSGRILIFSMVEACRFIWTEPALAVEFRFPSYVAYTGPVETANIYLVKKKLQLLCVVSRCDRNVAIIDDLRSSHPNGLVYSVFVELQSEGYIQINPVTADYVVSFPKVPTISVPMSKIGQSEFLPGQQAVFGNPQSPFEVRCGDYRWMYKLNRFVQIHHESVNTVLIRSRLPDPVNYVLVSGDALVLKARNTVASMETTLMPHMPGMSAILSALFAPTWEPRFKPQSEQLYGFYCGLGAVLLEPETKNLAPVFEEHDFLVVTDGELDSDDISCIQDARDAIKCIVDEATVVLGGKSSAEVKKLYVENILPVKQAAVQQTVLSIFNSRVRSPQLNHMDNVSDNICPRRWTMSLSSI